MSDKIYKKIIIAIFIVSLILKLVYIAKTPFYERQHDVVREEEHLAYINEIYVNHRLPQTNENQYYHPPLHHILCAGWLAFFELFTSNKSVLYESLQILIVLYSMILVYIFWKIINEFEISPKNKIIALIVVAWHPSLTIMSGSLNNDLLVLLLMVLIIYLLISWNKNTNWKNTILMALCTGLCVMTKISGAIMSIPIAFVFLYKLYINRKDKSEVIKFIKYYAVFGAISLPIGLWYPIRNYILFSQNILYILNPDYAPFYVGNYSKFSRFFPFSNELFKLYSDPYDDYNIPIYLLKNSLFGEYQWECSNLLLYVPAILCNFVLFILFIYSIIKTIFNKKEIKKYYIEKIMLFLTTIISISSYISVNINYPYGCSMDFRYIIINVFIMSIFEAFLLESKKNKKLDYITLLSILMVCIPSNIIILLEN